MIAFVSEPKKTKHDQFNALVFILVLLNWSYLDNEGK